VAATALVSPEPFSPRDDVRQIFLEGATSPGKEELEAAYRVASPGYLRALRIPLLRGRFLQETDVAGGAPVAVVSVDFARRYFPGEDALGRHFRFAADAPAPAPAPPLLTIVGVIADVTHSPGQVEPTAFLSYRQAEAPTFTFLARARRPGADLAGALRSAMTHEDPTLALGTVLPYDEQVSSQAAYLIIPSALLAFFGVIAALLAAIALHVTVSEHATRRTREAGIRMALGADALTIISMIMNQGLKVAAVGSAIGLAAGLLTIRLLGRNLGFDLEPSGMMVALVLGGLLVLAAISALIPATRASRISPLSALRCE
jgi:putative ABC transport system permease protein